MGSKGEITGTGSDCASQAADLSVTGQRRDKSRLEKPTVAPRQVATGTGTPGPILNSAAALKGKTLGLIRIPGSESPHPFTRPLKKCDR